MKRHAAELVTVFLGVVLAFLAEDWREYRSDRAEEGRVLAGLAVDFAENSRQRTQRIEWQNRATSHLAELHARLVDASIGSSLSIPDTLLTATFYAATYDPARGSLDALLSSGRLEIIRDEELRAALAEWPSKVADASEDQAGQRRFVNDTLLPYFMEMSLPGGRLIDGHLDWVRGSPAEDLRAGTVTVRVTEDLRTLISLRLFIARLATADLNSLAAHAERIQGMLPSGASPAP